ncbi:telomere-associated protein Tap [Streptomyces liangshanensis]|uniref:telomere-associated protein Tap n=1 Tax=Streptomyces liangshanensis TaxID=2717324 RepID=UPI0036DB9349
MSESLFDGVDALLARPTDLPPPAERERLRKAGGFTQQDVATALGVSRVTLVNWESGRTEPRPPARAAYARLLDALAVRHPVPAPEPVPVPAAFTGRTPAATVPAPAAAPASAGSAPAGRRASSSRRPAAKKAAKPAPAPAADPRFVHGPVGVLDGDGAVYCADGTVLECPATTVADLVAWTLAEARLGAAQLHRSGQDADPLIVVTASAADRLGLPATLEDRQGLRLPEGHPVVKQITRAGWQLTRRGFGPWPRIYRPAVKRERQCVQLAIVPWGALEARAWPGAEHLAPGALAHLMTRYARLVTTPRGSTAVTGLHLMTALRPPTRAVKDETTGGWVSGPVPGSLHAPVDPAPCEAPDEHPVAAALYPEGHDRTPAEVLDEEAYDWSRPLDLITGEEGALPWAVGLDVNTAFLNAAARLRVGLGPAEHVDRPAFDAGLPGSWLVDLSHIDLDPRLPSPFTPSGERPTGPAWYATPTVAYAVTLGYDVRPLEAYVRPLYGPYLDPWYNRLSAAYKAVMGEIGLTRGMDETAYLDAMALHQVLKSADPHHPAAARELPHRLAHLAPRLAAMTDTELADAIGHHTEQAMLLSAIKGTVKGGIGKLRTRPKTLTYRHGDRWSALDTPTWRPDIRAAVISTARVDMHKKMTALATAGLYPIGVLSDCAAYLSPGPSPLDLLPRTEDGGLWPGAFRLGVSPGQCKHEGTQSAAWAVDVLEDEGNPARLIKGTDAVFDGGE